MRRAASAYMASGALGNRVKNSETALLLMLKARELGIGDVYGLSQLYCVNGVVAMQGQVMLDMIYRSGKVKVSPDQGDDYAALTLTRVDGLCDPYTSRWDLQRVQDAGFRSPLYKNKALRGRKMLYLCVAEAARVVCPEVLSGTYAVEEFGVASLDELTPGVVANRFRDDTPPVGIAGKDHVQALYKMVRDVDANEAKIILAKHLENAGVGAVKDMGHTCYYQLVSELEQALHEYGVEEVPVGPNLEDPPPEPEDDTVPGEVVPETVNVTAYFPAGDQTTDAQWRAKCKDHGLSAGQIMTDVLGTVRDVTPDDMPALLEATARQIAAKQEPDTGMFAEQESE